MKKEHISVLALIVSAISLIVSIISIVTQYKEELIINVGQKECIQIDYEQNTIKCRVELMLSNTAHAPFSVIKCDVRQSWTEYSSYTSDEIPIMLSQGESERIYVYFDYPLNDEIAAILQENANNLSAIKDNWFSIQLSTPKKRYPTNGLHIRDFVFIGKEDSKIEYIE